MLSYNMYSWEKLTTKVYILFIPYNHRCRILNDLRSMYFAGSISLLVDHFLDLFHDSILHKMQATMIINELMMGAVGEGGRVLYTAILVWCYMLPLLSGFTCVCCKCCMDLHVYVAMLNGVICCNVVWCYMLPCCMVSYVAMLYGVIYVAMLYGAICWHVVWCYICCHVVWCYICCHVVWFYI